MCAHSLLLDGRQHIELLLRVARMYYLDELDQSTIAEQLGYSRSRISRLLSEARERKIVQFQIGHPLSQSLDLEARLCKKFGLAHAWVASDVEELSSAEVVGALAAGIIQEQGRDGTILALSNGRSVAAVVQAMPRLHWPRSVVIQMIGSLGAGNHLVDSPELCRTLAHRLGGTFRPLPVPIILGSTSVARGISREEMVLTTLELAARSDIAVLGVGTVGRGGSSGLILKPFLTAKDNEEIRRRGAVAHISGHHYDKKGHHVNTSLCQRTIAMAPERLADIKLPLLVAWGVDKVPAISAALRAGLGLVPVLDEDTAQALLSYTA